MILRNCIRFATYLVIAAGLSVARAGSYEEFFSAISRDDARAVTQLQQRGFDSNTRDPKGRPGLYVALQAESYDAAAALLADRQIEVNALNETDESPLMMAAMKGRLDWVQRLIARGAQISKPGWAPIHYAAIAPDDTVLAFLADQGADLNAASPNRTTPLMMAARYGTEGSVQRLLQRGADTRRTNDHGLTAADFARTAGREALANQLQSRTR